MQVDTVAHCGEWMSGKFAWTLTVTCMVSGWPENETIMGKDGYAVKIALERIKARLLLKISTLNFDNGPEFMIDDVIKRFAQRKDRALQKEKAHDNRNTPVRVKNAGGGHNYL